MADMILITKAAEEKKIGDDAAFKKKLEFARNKLMMEGLLASVATTALTEPAMRAVYDDAVGKLPAEEEVQARHILFRAAEGDEKAGKEAEAKAKAVVARLAKGEDFAKIANELTEDPSGKTNGGDLGYFSKEQMVPEFANVAFAQDKGKVSAPVKTQFGWHVIKTEDKRTKAKPTFEEVKPQIEQFAARKAQAELVTKLRADAKIVKNYTVEAPKADAPGAPAAPAAPKQ
jgi:peptidyl-prolyl cis-trans isomerase C